MISDFKPVSAPGDDFKMIQFVDSTPIRGIPSPLTTYIIRKLCIHIFRNPSCKFLVVFKVSKKPDVPDL